MMDYHNVYYLEPTRARPLVRNYEPPKPKGHSAGTVIAAFFIGSAFLVVSFAIMAPLIAEQLIAYLNSH